MKYQDSYNDIRSVNFKTETKTKTLKNGDFIVAPTNKIDDVGTADEGHFIQVYSRSGQMYIIGFN